MQYDKYANTYFRYDMRIYLHVCVTASAHTFILRGATYLIHLVARGKRLVRSQAQFSK